MTKRFFSIILVPLLALFFLIASPVSGQEIKVGVVNAAKVLEEAPQMEAARKTLEKEFAPRDKELVELQKSVRNLEEKLSRDGDIMSDVEQRKMERDIRSRKRELKRLQDEFNEDLNLKRNEAFDRIRRKVLEVVNAIGKQENFDLIVNDGVLYASDRIDITNAVIKQLKSEQAGGAANSKK
ncbi:OmpH family outer membrane protein [Kaarinaea lacus]